MGAPAATFPWPETGARLRQLLADGPVRIERRGRWYELCDAAGEPVRQLHPPVVLPPPDPDPERYLSALPEQLGHQVIVLLQAGAASLGLWHGDELLAHKVFKRYVVRGKGRAQPTHLATKGKSRYGSRLRLRNAQLLLSEVNERLQEWFDRGAPIEQVLYSCPVRLWTDLHRCRPAPPFAADAARPIPLDVAVPGFEELLRVRRRLQRGRIVAVGETGRT